MSKEKLEELEWHIEKRIVKDLLPDKDNPREMTDREMDELKRSIRKFGYATRIEVDKDNTVVAGNQRLIVLKAEGKGDNEIEVLVPNRKLTNEEFREYSIRNNLNTGHFNMTKLSDFDEQVLRESGFQNKDLNKIFKDRNFGEDKPEIEFTEELMEEHNYIVLYFDNEVDWLQAKTLFDIKSVKSLDSRPGFEKIGIGRVVNGSKAIRKILEEAKKVG